MFYPQIDAFTNRVLTYQQLKTSVENIASHLYYNFGVKKGTIVTFYAANSVECAVFILSVWRLGGTVALLNPLSTPGNTI